MRQFTCIRALVLPVVLMAGCSKPGARNTVQGSSSNLLVKSVVQLEYNASTGDQTGEADLGYTYDASNREATATETLSTINGSQTTTVSYTFTFTYSADTVTETGSSNNVQSTTQYYINAAGTQMDSMRELIVEGSGALTELSEIQSVYTYNASGNCMQVSNSESFSFAASTSGITYYTYTGNDITEVLNTAGGVSVNSSYTYNGTTGNVDAEPISFLPIFFHRTFDLPITVVVSGTNPQTKNYAYTFDSQHRVTGITGTSATGTVFLKETVTYDN